MVEIHDVREETLAGVRARARHDVYERLALLSATIWALGTLALFILIVPYIAHPQRQIAVAMTVPLIPAALPWVFYPAISAGVARRRIRRTSQQRKE